MKKRIFRGFAAAVTMLIGAALLFTACQQDVPESTTDDTPTVTSVTITINDALVPNKAIKKLPNSELEFDVEVAVQNNADKTVNWTVTGGGADISSIDASGKLSIGAEAADTVLTVKATSTVDPTKYDTVAVTILSATAPVVNSVIVTAAGNATTVEQGKTLQFDADVDAENSATEDVTWSISGHNTAGTTDIDANGLLTVDINESVGTAITVTATSEEPDFEDMKNSVTVTVVAPLVPLGTYEFYKGRPKEGLTVIPLEDYPWYHTTGTSAYAPGTPVEDWDANIELNAAGEGRNGGSAIKVGRSAVNGDSGFGLAFDDPIDMSNVKALSFWAKTDQENFNVKRFGFGDAGEYGTPHEYGATHKGVLYTGEANNNTNPLTNVWKRFIVPVPGGCTAPNLSRVFTLIATIPDDNFLLIDDIEFLTTGVTCTGLKVPAVLQELVRTNKPFDITALFSNQSIAWEFKLDADNSKYTIYAVPDGAWYHLTDWNMPQNYNRFTVSEITGANASAIEINDVRTTITSNTPEISITLTLKNGQDFETNEITVTFDDGNFNPLIIGDFSTLTGNVNDADNQSLGYWASAWWAAFLHDQPSNEDEEIFIDCIGSIRNEGYSGFGRNGRNWDLSEYDAITFSLRAKNDDAYSLGNTYQFMLENGSTEIIGASITIAANMDYNWVDITIPLTDFVALDLTAVTGWRLVLQTNAAGNNSLIYISSIIADLVD